MKDQDKNNPPTWPDAYTTLETKEVEDMRSELTRLRADLAASQTELDKRDHTISCLQTVVKSWKENTTFADKGWEDAANERNALQADLAATRERERVMREALAATPENKCSLANAVEWRGSKTDFVHDLLSEIENRVALSHPGTVEGEVESPTAKFQAEVSQWASATFPHQTPESKVAHLSDEVKELVQEPLDGIEMADCYILLLNLAQMAGVDLYEKAQEKMTINRARKWGKPDSRGVCNHIDAARKQEGEV